MSEGVRYRPMYVNITIPTPREFKNPGYVNGKDYIPVSSLMLRVSNNVIGYQKRTGPTHIPGDVRFVEFNPDEHTLVDLAPLISAREAAREANFQYQDAIVAAERKAANARAAADAARPSSFLNYLPGPIRRCLGCAEGGRRSRRRRRRQTRGRQTRGRR